MAKKKKARKRVYNKKGQMAESPVTAQPETQQAQPTQEAKPAQAQKATTQSQGSFKKRNTWIVLVSFIVAIAVLIPAVITRSVPLGWVGNILFWLLGIYVVYWLVVTTTELRTVSKSPLTPWSLFAVFVPFVGGIFIIVYFYFYAKGFSEVTGKSKWTYFLGMWFLLPIAHMLIQKELNKKAAPAA